MWSGLFWVILECLGVWNGILKMFKMLVYLK